MFAGNAASFNADDGFSTMKNSSESSENPSRPVSRYVSNNVYIFNTRQCSSNSK